MNRPLALTFDVFGTLVDWRGGITYEGTALYPDLDWNAVAERWMQEYGRSVSKLTEWVHLELILKNAFHKFAHEFGIDLEFVGEFPSVWERLRAWPDALAGFAKLRNKVSLVALSNANVSMMSSLEITSGLRFDHVCVGEQTKAYKPAPAVYQNAVKRLKLEPSSIMMVAAHTFDLNAAKKQGFRTALITRKGEPGSDPSGLDHYADLIAPNVSVLADFILSMPAPIT